MIDDDGEHGHATPVPQLQMPLPSKSLFPASSRGGRVVPRAPLPPPQLVREPRQEKESPLVIRSREKKIFIIALNCWHVAQGNMQLSMMVI